jgi:hypothetical protein
MEMRERYQWEAERGDGTIVSEGADLSGCVRFSLIPRAAGLPQHDVTGVPMLRRFCRGFMRVLGPNKDEYVHCVVCPEFRFYVRSSDGAALVTPADYELYL